MRLAAVLAGLLLNAGFLEFVFEKSGWGVGWFAMLAGPVVWGLFLLFGGLLVPARLGLGARELVERVLGRWVGGAVWWVLIPAWLMSGFGYQTQFFAAGMRVWFLREGETWRSGLDNELAVHWPWLVLMLLPGWSSVPVRVAAVVLVFKEQGARAVATMSPLSPVELGPTAAEAEHRVARAPFRLPQEEVAVPQIPRFPEQALVVRVATL